jgi:hypothetical protein
LSAICDLKKRDIQMALEFLGLDLPEEGMDGGTLLCLAAYDILLRLGLKDEALMIIKKFFKEIYELGNDVAAHPGERKKLVILQINDNRFAWITNDHGKIFDLKELSFVERCPLPMIFVGIALPGLFERAVAALESLRGQRRARALQQSSESGPTSAS